MSKRSKTSISINSELHEQLKTLAALKNQSLSKTVNLALEDWLEVVGLGEIERITGVRNPKLPNLPAHIGQKSAAPVLMLTPRRIN